MEIHHMQIIHEEVYFIVMAKITSQHDKFGFSYSFMNEIIYIYRIIVNHVIDDVIIS